MEAALRDWLAETYPALFAAPDGRYAVSLGAWSEQGETNRNIWFCAIISNGGAPIDVDDRRKRFRIVLAGRRDTPEDKLQVSEDMELIVQATLGDTAPCDAAAIRAMGEPIGPGTTAENRAWYSLDLQVTF